MTKITRLSPRIRCTNDDDDDYDGGEVGVTGVVVAVVFDDVEDEDGCTEGVEDDVENDTD